jgi:Domain of unknown function (DUF4440)
LITGLNVLAGVKVGQKDIATLKALLSDDLVYTHSSARLDTKQSLIGAMESGATVYTSVEPSDVKAQDLGAAVVLTGTARISVTSNGNPINFGVRFTTSMPTTTDSGRWWPGSRPVCRSKPPGSLFYFGGSGDIDSQSAQIDSLGFE